MFKSKYILILLATIILIPPMHASSLDLESGDRRDVVAKQTAIVASAHRWSMIAHGLGLCAETYMLYEAWRINIENRAEFSILGCGVLLMDGAFVVLEQLTYAHDRIPTKYNWTENFKYNWTENFAINGSIQMLGLVPTFFQLRTLNAAPDVTPILCTGIAGFVGKLVQLYHWTNCSFTFHRLTN